MAEGVFLELQVRVEKDWQRRSESVDRVLDVDAEIAGPHLDEDAGGFVDGSQT